MAVKFVWRSRDPMRFLGAVEDASRKLTVEVAREIFEGVVMRTPVRTGVARASWRVSVGRRDYSTETTFKRSGEFAPLPAPVFPLVEVEKYGKIFITNSVPYIIPLEFGWSRQAPAGMVRVTLASLGISNIVRR